MNSFIILRSQLEAILIFKYLIFPKKDLIEIQKRVEDYIDWCIVKMYNNSETSKNFDLFNLSSNHKQYLKEVEMNYNYVKNKFKDNNAELNKLNRSTFLKDKKKFAEEIGMEDLYKAVFPEGSASVHIADLSDIMIKRDNNYEFKFNSDEQTMMISGLSNILLAQALTDFIDFFEFPRKISVGLLKAIHN